MRYDIKILAAYLYMTNTYRINYPKTNVQGVAPL